jgi:hypothetical protein
MTAWYRSFTASLLGLHICISVRRPPPGVNADGAAHHRGLRHGLEHRHQHNYLLALTETRHIIVATKASKPGHDTAGLTTTGAPGVSD